MNMPVIAVTKDDQSLKVKQLVHDWVSWLYTRRFYAAPVPQNILVRMMEEHQLKGEPPNARNDALCSAFNKVMILAHATEPEYSIPFMYVYLKQFRPRKISALAIDLNIDSDTVYQRAHAAATRYYRQAENHVRLSSMDHSFKEMAVA